MKLLKIHAVNVSQFYRNMWVKKWDKGISSQKAEARRNGQKYSLKPFTFTPKTENEVQST